MKPIRVGICVLIAFSVLAHGAVEVWSSTILEIGAAILLIAWGVLAIRQREIELRWNCVYVPLLLLGAWALLQRLAGFSAYPYNTQVELLKATAYLVLFFLTIESFRTLEDWKSFVWFLISLGFAVSLLAVVQYFTFNGRLYWVRPLAPGVAPFGPFVNRNHFAGFIELTVPFGLAMLFSRAVGKDKLLLLVLLTVVPISALALSASRGGIVSFLFEFLLLAAWLGKKVRQRDQLLLAGGLTVAAALLAVWLGLGLTVQRFEHSRPGDISRDRRMAIFKDTLRIIRDHPWRGTGFGTFETVFPRYESLYDGLIVDHAHNDYLELLSDTGLIGGLCIAAFLILLVRRGWLNLRAAKAPLSRCFYSGAFVGCTGLLLHAFVDFNFHIPSNALLFLLLAAMLTSKISEAQRAYPQNPQPKARIGS